MNRWRFPVRTRVALSLFIFFAQLPMLAQYGPETCKPGYVWREACGPKDHVCVLPQTRDQAANDNAQAASRFLNVPVLWDVLTQHNDSARSGAQLRETTLNPTNVRPATFGRLYERYVEGQIITQ